MHRHLTKSIAVFKYCHGKEDFVLKNVCDCVEKCKMVTSIYKHMVKFYTDMYCHKTYTYKELNGCECTNKCKKSFH